MRQMINSNNMYIIVYTAKGRTRDHMIPYTTKLQSTTRDDQRQRESSFIIIELLGGFNDTGNDGDIIVAKNMYMR